MAKERKSRGQQLDEVTPIGDGKKFDSEIDIFPFSEETHTQVRLIGSAFSVKTHWVPTIRKDGSRSSFPKLCLFNDPDAETCPYCKVGLSTNTRYMMNAIIRDLEEARPKKATWDENAKFKVKGDDNWTPVRVVAFPASIMQKILNFKSLTKVKTKDGVKTFHVSHEKYGRDLNIKLEPSGTGSGMYDVQRESVSKLEGDELEYLLYDIDTVYDAVETEEEALATLKSCFERGVFEGAKNRDGKSVVNLSTLAALLGLSNKKKLVSADDIPDDEDDDEEVVVSKKSSKKSKKSSKYEEDEPDDLDDELDEEEDEDEPSPKKSKKKTSKKSRSDDDEELDELEEDEELDEEEEKPKKKTSSKKSKKKVVEEDEDEELEEDEEESSSKKKKSSKKSRKQVEEEDEELDELEEDEDEEEKPKKKKTSSKKSKKKVEEEDEDELDELEDEDEEEKPRKGKSSKKSKRKVEEDEDEELEEDEEEKPRKGKSSKKSKKKVEEDEDDDLEDLDDGD